MSLKIEMTGKEDLDGPWKLAIAGFPGAGKTLLASTARDPLFVFFEETPRIKSIASRHIPHVKLVNAADGHVTVQDQLNALIMGLNLSDEVSYQTLVIDTGDELLQKMKQARRIKNGGEFNIGDWVWLADTYREVITALVDLPMDIVVLYHLKTTQEGEQGVMVREMALQGSSKDEAPGWFDVVGVLDTFETADEQGDDQTKRVLLTHQSRTYPWLKDHSGQLPTRWTISDNFVGDLPRLLLELSQSSSDFKDGQEHQVIAEIAVEDRPVTKSGAAVPSPEELQAKKAGTTGDNDAAEPETITPEPEPPARPLTEEGEEEGQEGESAGNAKSEEKEPEEPIPAEPESELPAKQPSSPEQDEEPPGEPSDEAQALVESELGGELVYPCQMCGENVTDEGLRELTQIRFRAILCRPHFKDKLAAARA